MLIVNSRERFLAALNGSPVDRPPVWLMRQAGRYLPDYRAVRGNASFWELCRSPELTTRVALEPLKRFKLDAAIVFSDILVVPQALGLGVTFGPGEGPRLEKKLTSVSEFAQWTVDGAAQRLEFVSNAVRHLSSALNGSHGLIGFAGAPFTLLAYCTAGGGSDDFLEARTMLHQQPALAERALFTLADVTAQYLEAQFAAGADVVQLFDTWGGLLDRATYARFALPAIRRITEPLRARGHRVLLFVRGGAHLLPVLGEANVDGFALDWRTDWREARALFPRQVLQGNLDPALLLAGPTAVRKATRHLISTMRESDGASRCIVNLGHG
ncbi:MAG: uroporphyrinogen decarboxylase, partial [Archangium sp.]|nr:uroporphyrinogen decarboxylase [Archangium sp.]